MKDTQSITIAVLTASAALLLTAVLLAGGSDRAVAAQAESQGREYTMIAGQATSQRDILYVVDRANERLIAYTADRDIRNRQILLIGGPVDLGRLVLSAQPQPGPAR
ncbi:MAG: hypothetical protein GX591_11330 [Planctomycetes bacterium]|nr:hypothetical protein [Planctomycetota bacterium]